MSISNLAGVVPPLMLPLTERGDIDEGSLCRQIDFLLDAGVHGLWVNGTTGDFFALSDSERLQVAEVCVRHVDGRVPIIVQVGDCATRRVIEKGEQAVGAGCDGVSVVLPYYLDYSQEELKRHYREISRALGRPIFLYQLPQMCKVALAIPNILELSGEGVLAGIKDSAGDVDFYYRLVRGERETATGLRCFYGASSLVDVGLYVGGHGVMCAIANLVPHLALGIYEAASEEDWKKASRLNSQILELIDALRLPARSNWAPTVATYKWIMKELGVIDSDRVFAPLQPLTEEERAPLKERALPLVRNSWPESR